MTTNNWTIVRQMPWGEHTVQLLKETSSPLYKVVEVYPNSYVAHVFAREGDAIAKFKGYEIKKQECEEE